MIPSANRLQAVEEYYFSRKLKEINLLKASGKPIINLGIGSPDMEPPLKVISALSDSLTDDDAHKYQSYQGLPELREAIAEFYKEHYKVHLSSQTEILPLMGSKEGIMHISLAFLNEDDQVLIPNPGYPTYAAVTKLVGAKPVFYDLTEKNNWLPDILKLERTDLSKVKLMWVNYPHMPTGAHASFKFYEDLVAFAKRNEILLVNDNPYSFILNEFPRSLLSATGAKDCCLELNSLSKTFNMAGWRVGMVCGHHDFLQAILKVKSNMDSGMFFGIQQGAIKALQSSKMWYVTLNNVYKQRRELIFRLASKLDCVYDMEQSGMFVWAKLLKKRTSEEFVETTLKNYNIFVAPGHIFGSNGEGYVRFSLCAPTADIEEALARIK